MNTEHSGASTQHPAEINRQLAELLGLYCEQVPGQGPHYRLRDPACGWTSPLCTSPEAAWRRHCLDYLRDANALLYAWGRVMTMIPRFRQFVVSGWGEAFHAQILQYDPRDKYKYPAISTSTEGATELAARVNCLIAILQKLREVAA